MDDLVLVWKTNGRRKRGSAWAAHGHRAGWDQTKASLLVTRYARILTRTSILMIYVVTVCDFYSVAFAPYSMASAWPMLRDLRGSKRAGGGGEL